MPPRIPGPQKPIQTNTRDALSKAIDQLVKDCGGNETEAAERMHVKQPTINRARNKKQELRATNIAELALAVHWSADRVLGLPPRSVHEMPPALVEAIKHGKHHGASIAAAAALGDLDLDVKAWGQILARIDEAIEKAHDLAALSRERPSQRFARKDR